MDGPGSVVPDGTGARREVVRHWARQIVTGHISPIEGARGIVRDGPEELDAGEDPMVFAGLVAEWDEGEARRPECEARIMDQAALLLADTAFAGHGVLLGSAFLFGRAVCELPRRREDPPDTRTAEVSRERVQSP